METLHCPDDGLLEIGLSLPEVVPGNVKVENVLAGEVDEVDELVHVHRVDLGFDLAVFHIACFLLFDLSMFDLSIQYKYTKNSNSIC